MTPKSLLRHPEARSSFDEMTENTQFKRVIPEAGVAAEKPNKVKKLVFCSGKVFYDLRKARDDAGLSGDIAISRVEQISPFPYDLIKAECQKYPEASLHWAQEEHKNQGAWTYVQPLFHTTLNGARHVAYIGRPTAASPATGSKMQFLKEQKSIYDDLLHL